MKPRKTWVIGRTEITVGLNFGGPHERTTRVVVVAIALILAGISILTGADPLWPWAVAFIVLFLAGEIAVRAATKRDGIDEP